MNIRQKKYLPAGLLLVLLFGPLLAGCGKMLPVARSHSESPWPSFAANKEVFDRIVPYRTTIADLKELQFDPSQTPNIQILTYPEIISLFIPNSSFRLEDMDQGLQDCVAASSSCQAYQLKLQRLDSRRHGNVLLDLFRFKRETHRTGWLFTSLVVLVDDVVVYKIWGGVPKVDEHLYQRNPLGPLQEAADAAFDYTLLDFL